MSVNYLDIYRDKVYIAGDTLVDEEVQDKLDTYAQIYSRKFSTPWGGFSTVPDAEKYGIVLVAAREFWWKKLAEFTGKHDTIMGGPVSNYELGQTSATMWSRALEMIRQLDAELEGEEPEVEGSGDITVGTVQIRSKLTGKLIPYESDIRGDWT